MTSTRPERNPIFVVLGGSSAASLRFTLARLAAPGRVLCVVRTEDEVAACTGLARAIRITTWRGRFAALATAHRLVSAASAGGPVVLLTSGTALDPRYVRRALACIERGAAIVVPSRRRARNRMLRFGGVFVPAATLRPGSGMVVDIEALARLVDAGWLGGTELTIRQIRGTAGPITRARSRGNDLPAASTLEVTERLGVTVMIPAHNEAMWIGDTIRSLRTQSRPPDDVLVIDDCSTDGTGAIAAALGARVVRTEAPALKAGAQRLGLSHVDTGAVVMIDADTTLHPEAVERLVTDLEQGHDASTGAVLPRQLKGVWARGRAVEYAFAQRITKPAQRSLGAVLVLSGCVTAARTDVLRAERAFEEPTITEDLDLTWRLHLARRRVGFTREALSYPVEPDSWLLFRSQLRRWAAGMCEAISTHIRGMHRRPWLLFVVVAALLDLVLAVVLLPLTLVLVAAGAIRPTIGGLALGMVFVVLPIVSSTSIIGPRRAILGMPAYLLIALLAQYFYFEAMVNTWVFRRHMTTWVKGH